jgi:hypothetical protein
MFRYRWIVTGAAVWHLTAISVASLPSPREIRPSDGQGNREPTTQLAWLAEEAYGQLASSAEVLWSASAPLRPLTRRYVRAIGLGQQWKMFSDPPDADQYGMMRYHVSPFPGARAAWADRELVFPIVPEDRYRPYTDSFFEEKAFRTARQRYLVKLQDLENVTRVADLPRDLLPIIRFYAERYRARHLSEGEEIVVSELWFGRAPVPIPGGVDPGLPEARKAVLRSYYEEPRSQLGASRMRLPVGSTEREADIEWTLVYFEDAR